MSLIDTHCHIHDIDYPLDGDEVIGRAHIAGVMRMICIGTNIEDSKDAIGFASKHDGVFATAGIHPHYAEKGVGNLSRLVGSVYSGNDDNKLVAIGEIGLDYFTAESSRESQIKILQQQIEIALKYDLPIVFHIRDAFDDFWPVLDNFHGIRGVLHCFTDTQKNADEGLKRDLFFGLNGISTFTKDGAQKAMFASIPMDKVLLETDAPFLTPTPLRGKVKVNEPAFISEIAEYNAVIRQITFDEFANVTTANACSLFNL